ncbi:MAG: queuosine precursor transporter [Proteobacteria bacterium]|nr:queuosine precursor transporter [Pseudomonadota bacterium]MCH9758577.1 queuosine precursor transporter [Pseudomonadota bacterium]
MNLTLLYGVFAMAITLVVSNYLVQFPLGDWLTLAAFTYPIAFLVTDCVNRSAGVSVAAKVALFGFIFGVPLSLAFNYFTATDGGWLAAVRIAAASGMAFAIGQGTDIAIFNRLRKRAWWLPPLFSSLPASILDTALFFSLAFAGTDVPWVTLAWGDLAIKALMLLLLLPPYRLLTKQWKIA